MSEILISPEKASHWYTKNGKPMHSVPMKTKPGQFRPTTVKDAKELGLLPSVTAIQSIVYKPALQAWIQTQLVLAALTLPKFPGETSDSFARRVVEDGAAEGKSAADFGTRVHAIIETYIRNPAEIPDVGLYERDFLHGFINWQYKNNWKQVELEKTFANSEEGFGGTVDFIGVSNITPIIADWKTQKTTPGKPITFYPEWNSQLAAYQHGTGLRDTLLVSVVISSTEPGRVESHEWPDDDAAWEVFKAKRRIYYSPEGQGKDLVKGVWYEQTKGNT